MSERLDRILSQKEMPVFEIDRSTIWKRVTVRDHLKEDTGRDRIGPLRRNLRSKVATKFDSPTTRPGVLPNDFARGGPLIVGVAAIPTNTNDPHHPLFAMGKASKIGFGALSNWDHAV